MIFLNIFPLLIVRRQLIETKENTLLTNAGTIAQALSGFAALTPTSVSTVLRVLDVSSYRRIMVTDASSRVIYDSMGAGPSRQFAILPEIAAAMEGKDAFTCRYSEESFVSGAVSPIMTGSAVAGTVYLYDVDAAPAELLKQTRSGIMVTSLIVGVLSVMFVWIYTRSMDVRLTALTRGIREMRSGNYGHRVTVSGNDELTEIAQEFCLLSDRLQTTENVRQQLISDVSHEIKTPLTAIKLLSDSIIQNKDMPPAEAREFLTDINDQIGRLSRITESLLTINRLDAGRIADPAVCDLAETVKKSAGLLRTLADSYDVTIETHVDGNFPVLATEDGLYHVVFNLMENAVKYNKPGGTVTVSLKDRDDTVLLTVQDSGIGIPVGEIGHIFERFYRVDKARSRESGGSGLGLSIVHDWVEQMGGHIDVFSIPDEGTRFSVILPRARKEGQHE